MPYLPPGSCPNRGQVGHWRTDCLTLPRESKVSPFCVPPPQIKLIFWTSWLKTDIVLISLPPSPWRPHEPGMTVQVMDYGLLSVILVDTQTISITLPAIIYSSQITGDINDQVNYSFVSLAIAGNQLPSPRLQLRCQFIS